MSTINTNGISVNYPVPGINNNSQGFRDNFASIKTNLNTAGTEITDLQNKVIVKSALANTVINNDMANTLISNALTRSFRATTFNLGSNISGDITIDVSLGDVQYGTIVGDTWLHFTGWSAAGTQSRVELQLSVTSESGAVLYLPAEIYDANCLGVTTLENFDGGQMITIPAGVCQLNYRLATLDCGASISIEPINRPRRSTQIRQRSPSPVGLLGDIAGTVAVDANYIYVCTESYNASTINKTISATYYSNLINCGTTTGLNVNDPIIFSSDWPGGQLYANTVYYIASIPDGSNITVSLTGFDGAAGANVYTYPYSPGGPSLFSATSYSGVSIWKRTSLAQGSAEFGDITVTGLATVAALTVPSPSNFALGGGTNGYILQTNGAGSLSWVIKTPPGTGSTPGGVNTNVQFNNVGVMGGSTNFTFNSSTNELSVGNALSGSGGITTVGTVNALNCDATANVTAQGYIIGGAIASNSLLIAAGNITGANLIGPLANGTSNIAITSSGNIAMTVGGVANVIVVSSTTLNTGNVAATGGITSAGALGIGYAAGAGGVITQLTSRTTSVIINKTTGSVTLCSAAGTNAYQTFTVTNSTVAVNDVIIINQKSGTDQYEAYVTNVAAGSFKITFATTGGTTVEQPVFSFAVIKGVAA